MKFERTDYGAMAVLAPKGDLSGDDADAFRRESTRCLDTGGAHLIIDCADITAFDSTGLEALTELRDACRARDGALRICGLDAIGRKIFEITRLAQQFELFDDVESAIRSST